jgi:hypothetical protein
LSDRIGLIAYWVIFIGLPLVAFIAAAVAWDAKLLLYATPVIFFALLVIGERLVRVWGCLWQRFF